MTDPYAEALIVSVRHYVDRTGHLIERLSQEPSPQRLLDIRLAPDMFDAGFNLAVALQFAARALCPPAGRDVPEIPEEITPETLTAFKSVIARTIATITPADLRHHVSHRAGNADLSQEPADYIARFALPNMIFHISLAYAAFRHGGMAIGKSDFDALHEY